MPAHREWIGARIYIFVQAYNTTKVKPEELPKTFNDLLDPRWKGRLGAEDKAEEWFYTLVQEMGEDKGLKFFRDLVATNGLSVRSGNSLLNNLVVAGEVPLALAIYSYLPEQSSAAPGRRSTGSRCSPTVAYTDGMAVARRAPHPNAAVLFYDFMFTEGQTFLEQAGPRHDPAQERGLRRQVQSQVHRRRRGARRVRQVGQDLRGHHPGTRTDAGTPAAGPAR